MHHLIKKTKIEFKVFANLSIREAIDKYGDPAKQAVISELQQLIRLKVHHPNIRSYHTEDDTSSPTVYL